jgi:hypothetical protein
MGSIERLVPAVVVLALGSACDARVPPDLDGAGEAVVRHLADVNFGAYPTPPWQVVCLSRRPEFGGEPEDSFLARFRGASPPVVATSRCVASEDDDSRWLVEGSGEAGLMIRLHRAERVGEDQLRIEASGSGGPRDFSVYACELVRAAEGWQVQDCVAFIMT